MNRDYTNIFEIIDNLCHELVGFISLNDNKNFGKIGDYDIYPFAYTQILNYDLALVDCAAEFLGSILPQLVNAGIPQNKIKSIHWLIQQIMTKKYEDFQDQDIQDTLEYWKTHDLSVFNQHLEDYPHTSDEIHIDENCGLPYIIFKTIEDKEKRMYFKSGTGTKGTDGKIYYNDILREQAPSSPHLYIKGNHKVNDGDILIDAGVCEGNFALRYVDVCSKIYLFEMDKNWLAPLYYTFKEYWDTKVVLIPKAVAAISGGGGDKVGRCHFPAY